MKNTREAAKKLEHDIKQEGGAFSEDNSEQSLGFLVYGEEVAKHYKMGKKYPSYGLNMLESDLVEVYTLNMKGDTPLRKTPSRYDVYDRILIRREGIGPEPQQCGRIMDSYDDEHRESTVRYFSTKRQTRGVQGIATPEDD